MAGLVLKVATHSVSDVKNGVVFAAGDFIESTPEFFKRYATEVTAVDPRKYPGVNLAKVKRTRFGGTLLSGAPAPEAPAPVAEKSAEVAEAAGGAGDEVQAEKKTKKTAMSTEDLKGGKEK